MSAQPSPIVPERINMAAACAITGKKPRRLQLMAKAGKVPSAAKIEGEWTFNVLRLRQWVRDLEDASCPSPATQDPQSEQPRAAPAAARPRPTPNGAATSCTAASASRASSAAGRYEQAMSNLLGLRSRRTSRG